MPQWSLGERGNPMVGTAAGIQINEERGKSTFTGGPNIFFSLFGNGSVIFLIFPPLSQKRKDGAIRREEKGWGIKKRVSYHSWKEEEAFPLSSFLWLSPSEKALVMALQGKKEYSAKDTPER